MKQGSTLFLKGVVVLIGTVVLTVCIFVLPFLIKSELKGDFDYGYIFLGLYITAIPFFLALYQAIKLLNYIEKNKAFSSLSVRALKNIKYSAVSISALFTMGMPYIFHVADKDDAPGLVALGFVIIFSSIIIATFAAVLQKLLQNAAKIKSENDLTV